MQHHCNAGKDSAVQRHRIHWYIKSALVFCFLLAFCGGSFLISQQTHAAVQTTYYVSPSGSDSNSGTSINSPFATIDHARQVVETVNSNMTGDIVVYLLGGIYHLDHTIEFTPRDSGTNGYQVRYEAYPSQTPVLSGGTQVTGWTQYRGSIYKAHLSRPDKLRNLYVNNHRAMMASKTITSQGCWGTYSVTAGQASWAWISGSQSDGVQFNTSDFPQVSSNISDVEMSTNNTWNQAIVSVRGTTTSGNHIVAQLQQPYGAIAEQPGWGAGFRCASGTSVTIYNAFSLLNSPGQFYFDRAAQTLYYDALSGEDMATATVIVPNDNLTTLLSIKGTSTTNRVQNLTFSGLTFAHTDWNLENIAGSSGKASVQGDTVSIAFAQSNWHNDVYRSIDTVPAMVMVDNSQNITFTRNVFEHTGADGLAERNDVIDSQTIGNFFYDIGGSAFSIDHPQHVYIGDGGTHEKFAPGVEGDCINDVFKDNLTLNTAVLFIGHAAVAAYFVNKFDFEHNVLQNTPYNGLSLGWGWRNFNGGSDSVFPGRPTTVAGNNTVSYNAFFDMVQTLTDTGAIYTLGAQPNTVLTGNYIKGIPNKGLSEGVHMDEGSAYITMTNTVVNVSQGVLSYSANNCCQQHDLKITNTYSTNGNIWTPIAANSVEDTPMVYPNANWPPAAQAIIQNAGLEPAYQDVGKTPTPTPTPSATGYAVNAGGAAVGSYGSDAYYSGGSTYSTTSSIDTSGLSNPAPQSVYQTERYGDFTYTLAHLVPGKQYIVRLHEAEIYQTSSGQRLFNVAINGQQVLSNFDIYAAAGGANKAIVKDFVATANGSGAIAVQFTSITDNAKVSGIEVLGTSSPTPTPTPTSGITPTPTPTATLGTTPTPTPTSGMTPTPTEGGNGMCRVSYAVNQWPGGFTANLTVTNTGGSPINGWNLQFSFPSNQQVQQGWNGTFSQSGNQVTITNLDYNGTLAPGASVTPGFNGSWSSSNPNPTAFTLNGTACSIG